MSQNRLHSSISKSLRFALVLAWAPSLAAEVSPRINPILAERAYWCWAASDRMVMLRYGVDHPQCRIVSVALGNARCCDNPLPSSCNTTGYPSFVNFGFPAPQTQPGALSWSQIQSEIGANRPFIFTWNYSGGGGSHLQVGSGWMLERVGMVRVMKVGRNDPTPVTGGFSWISYSNYQGKSGQYTSGTNYYNIRN